MKRLVWISEGSKCHNLHPALRSKVVASLVTDQAGIDRNLFQRASAHLVGTMLELSVSTLRSSDSAFDEDEEEDDWSDC